jgi:hypothetical protein
LQLPWPTAVNFAAAVAHDGKASDLKSRKLAQDCHNNSKKEERFGKDKRVRWRGRSSEALWLLRFIAGISLISTLLVFLLRYNENVITVKSIDF